MSAVRHLWDALDRFVQASEDREAWYAHTGESDHGDELDRAVSKAERELQAAVSFVRPGWGYGRAVALLRELTDG